MGSKILFFIAILSFSALSAFAENEYEVEASDPGLVMNFYKDTCPQAEDIIKEQVKLSTSATRTLPSLGSETSSMIVLFSHVMHHCY
jgi:hypothetical protein